MNNQVNVLKHSAQSQQHLVLAQEQALILDQLNVDHNKQVSSKANKKTQSVIPAKAGIQEKLS